MMTDHYTLNASEAAEKLGVSLSTLYSYVSRGMITSVPTENDSRQRRYSVADVEALLERRAARKDPDSVVQGTLKWGMPVMDSALTLIENGRVYYRGMDAVDLAHTQTLESVAAFMWTGELQSQSFESDNRLTINMPDLPELKTLGRMQVALALAAAVDLRAYDLRVESMPGTGIRIMRLLADVVAPHQQSSNHVAEQLAAAWIPDHPQGETLLNLAMVLCADHELNVSSFTARVVASAGTSLYAVVNAGLAALSGIKHGGVTGRIEAFFREIDVQQDARQVIAQRLQRGEIVPGFGHKLYPDGDPRAAELVEQALKYGSPKAVDFIESVREAGYAALGELPSLDFGLCALTRVLNLSAGSPMILFALGRTAGWIAHAIEQSSTSTLIRPRAHYTGVRP